MPTTVTVSSNYAGSAAGEIVGKAFKEADTIAKGLVTVLPDIDFQTSLRRIRYSDGRVDYSCGFTPNGAVTLDERLLTPKKIKNELEICKEDLRQIWSSATMGFSAHNDQMPADVEEALLTEILSDEAEAVDANIWTGVATNTGEFDGFIPLFVADVSVIKPTPLGSSVSKTNVLAEIEKVLNDVPIALRRKGDLKFMVSPDVALAFDQALISQGITNGFGGNGFERRYGVQVIEEVNGLPADTIVVAQAKNLVFGTGLMADHNEIRIKDMDESDLSGQVRYKMVYTAGVNYYNSEDIVYYSFV